MNKISVVIIFLIQLSLYQCINGQGDREEFTMIQGPKHSVILKAPKSIGNFFRRLFPGKNSNKDSQSMAPPGSPIPQQLGGPMYGAMGPMPLVPPFGPGSGAPSQFLPPYGSYASASFPSPVTIPPPSMSFGGQPYAMPPPGGMMHPHSPYGDQMAPHPSSPDFHSVLDTFVRNTGLTPAGSNPVPEVSPSKGGDADTPVFSFKKLYSFPFYLSTDSSGPSLSIPYMRQHVARRRMMAPLGSKVDFDIRSQSLHPHPLDPSRHPSLPSLPSLPHPSHPHPLVPRHPPIPHLPMAPSMQHKLVQNSPIGNIFPNVAPPSELHSVYQQQQQLLKALHSNDLITRYLQQAMKDTRDEDEGGKKQRKDLSSSSPSSSFSHQGKRLMAEGIDEEENLKKKKSSSSYSSSSYSPSSSSLASLLLSSGSEDGHDSDESSSSSPKDILSRDRLRDHRYITTTFLDKDDRDERSKISSSSSSRHHSASEDHLRFNSLHPSRNGNDGIIDDNDVDMLPNESTRVVQLTSSYSMAGNLGSGMNGISLGNGNPSSRTVNGITVTDHSQFVRRGTVL